MSPEEVSAGLAAVAAVASWASVLQTRRERRQAATPDLNVQVLVTGNPGYMEVWVDNAGSVGATGTNFMLVHQDQVDYGVVGTGFVSPGQTEGPIRTQVVAASSIGGKDFQCFVTCRDRSGILHAFSPLIYNSTSYKPGLLRGPEYPRKQEILSDLFPEVVLRGKIDVNTGQPIDQDW